MTSPSASATVVLSAVVMVALGIGLAVGVGGSDGVGGVAAGVSERSRAKAVGRAPDVVVVGAGLSGLTAALELADGGARVEFEAPVRAVSPGQAAVFYGGDSGEVILGGGWIAGPLA